MYSNNATDQLIKMTHSSGSFLYLRWPYHAIVMKIFDTVSRTTVFTSGVESVWMPVRCARFCKVPTPIKCSPRLLRSCLERKYRREFRSQVVTCVAGYSAKQRQP